jgi:hypothetical protein
MCEGCIRAHDGALGYLNWHIDNWHKAAPAARIGLEPSRSGGLKWSQKYDATTKSHDPLRFWT